MNPEKIIAVRTSKTIYKDGDTVIKMFDSNYDKSDILNEALNQARIETTGLNIPKIIAVNQINHKWSIVSEYIKGKTLARLMEENPDKELEYLNRFVDLQIHMHQVKPPRLNNLNDILKEKIELTDLYATKRYDLRMRLELMPRHQKLCHGDFHPSNIIITEKNQPYILDWSHVTRGNASADVARTYLLFWLEGNDALANKYLDIYCTKTDTAKAYVKQWLPIVATSQSVSRGLKKDRESLLSWLDMIGG